MKNILFAAFTCFFLSLISSASSGQSCTPNNDTVPGIEPDTLGVVYVNVPFEEIIYFRLPADTTVLFVIGQDTIPVHVCIDSLTIDSVHGLPNGFSFGCHVPWCSVLGGGNGCASLTGTASQGQEGFYPLDVFITIYTNDCLSFSLPKMIDTVTIYYLQVQGGVGMEEAQATSDFSMGTCFPNPVSAVASVPYSLKSAGELHISVLNLDGRMCLEKNIPGKPGYHVELLDISGLNEGSYFIRLEYTGKSLFSKLQVLRN